MTLAFLLVFPQSSGLRVDLARSISFVRGTLATSPAGQDTVGSVLLLITLIEASLQVFFYLFELVAAESTYMSTFGLGSGSNDLPLRWLASLVA